MKHSLSVWFAIMLIGSQLCWGDHPEILERHDLNIVNQKFINDFNQSIVKNDYTSALRMIRKIPQPLKSERINLVKRLVSEYFSKEAQSDHNVIVPYVLDGNALPIFMFPVFWIEMSKFSSEFRMTVLSRMKNVSDTGFYPHIVQKLSSQNIFDRMLALEWIRFIDDSNITRQVENMISEESGDMILKSAIMALKNKSIQKKTLDQIRSFMHFPERIEIKIALIDFFKTDPDALEALVKILLRLPNKEVRKALIVAAIDSEGQWIQNVLSQEFHNKEKAGYLYEYLNLCMLHDDVFEKIEWLVYRDHPNPQVRELCFKALVKSEAFRYDSSLWTAFFMDSSKNIREQSVKAFLEWEDVDKISVWREVLLPKHMQALKEILKHMKKYKIHADDVLKPLLRKVENVHLKVNIMSALGDLYSEYKPIWHENSKDIKIAMVRYWVHQGDRASLHILDEHVLKTEYEMDVLYAIAEALPYLDNRSDWLQRIMAIDSVYLNTVLMDTLPFLDWTSDVTSMVEKWLEGGPSQLKFKFLKLDFKKEEHDRYKRYVRLLLKDPDPLVQQQAFKTFLKLLQEAKKEEKTPHTQRDDLNTRVDVKPQKIIKSTETQNISAWLTPVKNVPDKAVNKSADTNSSNVDVNGRSTLSLEALSVKKTKDSNVVKASVSSGSDDVTQTESLDRESPEMTLPVDEENKASFVGESDVNMLISILSQNEESAYFTNGLLELVQWVIEP